MVPFLAVVLREDFALGTAAVGAILGLRTFAQQGMFLAGGLLVDHLGPRRVVLAGCLVRVAGFAALAAALAVPSPSLPLFVLGTVLTGLGGALFSPGLSTLLGAAQARREAGRISLFAWLTVTGEVGAVAGPLLGAALLPQGFATVAGAGAVFFAVVGGFLVWALPSPPPTGRPRPRAHLHHTPSRGAAPALPDRRFTRFATVHAVDLLAYNQLYLALPLLLHRTGAGEAEVARLFAWASVLTLVLQPPLAAWAAHVGPRRALRTGYGATATAFALLAAGTTALAPTAPQWPALVAAASATLVAGHLLAQPTAMGLVARFADGRPTGAYFGLLATAGGVAVLLGNVAVGRASELGAGQDLAALPWVVLAVPAAYAALAVGRTLRPLDTVRA